MMFNFGDLVKVKVDGVFIDGTIDQDYGDEVNGKHFLWVKHASSFTEFPEYNIFNLDDLINWNKPKEHCVCGAWSLGSDRHTNWYCKAEGTKLE